MRRAAIGAFFSALVIYPVAFIVTMRAMAGELHDRFSPPLWYAGRALALLAVALLAFAVIAPFFGDDRAKRVWWVVPATVVAIAVTYFDLIGFGVAP